MRNKYLDQQLAIPWFGEKVLDIGYVRKPLIMGSGYYGLDIFEKEVPNYKETVVTDLNEQPIPYPDKSFDTVYMGETLTCLLNLKHILNEVRRVLKDNGRLIIVNTNPSYYREVLHNVFLNHYKAFDPTVLFKIPRTNMRVLMEQFGFSIEREYGLYFRIPFLAWIQTAIFPGISNQIIYILKKHGTH
jgi:SAM-dependent methyltransferase